MSDRVVFLTNIPAPYREKVHEFVSDSMGEGYTVVYCSSIEKNREWKFQLGSYPRVFLESKVWVFRKRSIYLQSNVVRILKELNPMVVIIGGFSVPMIAAFIWALINRRKIISFSDANIDSEKRLTQIHRMVRKLFYSISDAFIGASQKTFLLFKSYGAEDSQLFQSHLCANNEEYLRRRNDFSERYYDVMLCGQMVEGKMFDFSIDVIESMLKNQSNLKVKVLGSGPLKEHVLFRLRELGVEFDYPGFVSQDNLPIHYCNSKILFFPTLREAWGVVANEACASGTPVITCPAAGVANELIIHDYSGYVCLTDVEEWSSLALELLNNRSKWLRLSSNAREIVKQYNYKTAADGINSAISFVNRDSGL